MPRSIILLHPSDVPTAPLDAPWYAEVTSRRRGATVSVRTLEDSEGNGGDTIRVPATVVDNRLVPAAEVDSGLPGWLLFRAVVAERNGEWIHGQVTAYDNTTYTISSNHGKVQVPHRDATEVAPAIVFLLHSATLLQEVRTVDDLDTVHSTILDRLLGQNGHQASRSIPTILRDLTTKPSTPRASDTVEWTCPRTGLRQPVPVGTVIDFAFYMDGERTPPPGTTLGQWYCQIVQRASTSRQRTRSLSARGSASNPRDVAEDDDDSIDDERDARFVDLLASIGEGTRPSKRQRANAPTTAPTPPSVPTPAAESPQTKPAVLDPAILQALASYPHALASYVRQIHNVCAPVPQSLHVPANGGVSDLVRYEEPSERTSGFHPTRPQQAVHQAITSLEHAGKTPDVFMADARDSDAVKFLPHPAVMSRLYDFQFGTCALSVLHFGRFTLDSQLAEAEEQSTNLTNFSASLPLPRVPSTPSFECLKDALTVLSIYADEFFDEHTRRFVTHAQRFCSTLSDFGPWSTVDVKSIAFWFGKVFGAYRRATVHDIASGELTRTALRDRLCMQDAEMTGVIMKASRQLRHQRLPSTLPDRPPTGHHAGARGQERPQIQPRDQNKRRLSKMPQEIVAHIPLEDPPGSRQLCLKYVSKVGCKSTSPDRMQPYLAHFDPPTPHPSVRQYIIQRFGGLGEKFASL